MPSTLRIEGVAAVVEYGYHTAATLGAWRVEDGQLDATIRSSNAFHLTQRPLWFTVERPPFKRRLLDITIQGDRLHGRLGPRE